MYHGGGGPPMGGMSHGGPPGMGRRRGRPGTEKDDVDRPGRFRLSSALDADEAGDEILGKIYDLKILKRFPQYLWPVKNWILLGATGLGLRTVAMLAMPWLVAKAIDDSILTGNLNGLNIIAGLFIGAALLMWGGQYMETLFLAYAGRTVLYRVRTQMFDHLHRLSLGFFDCNKVGKLMSRVQNDVQQVQQLVTSEILHLITSVFSLVGIVGIMLMMNAKLALITLVVVPVLAIVVIIWQRFARRAFIRVRKAIAEVNDQLQEGISGVRVVQGLSREEESFDQFSSVNKAHLDANITAVKLQGMMMPTVQIMTGIAFCLVLIFGGSQVIDGTMKVGVLLGFLLYVQRFFDPVMELTMMYTDLQRAMASASRIFELLDVEPEIEDSPDAIEMPPIKGEVKFDNVTFAYEPGQDVLKDIDLTVSPGETVAIVGRTGAGKSSLVNLGARLYEVEVGEVTIDGYNVKSVTQDSLRRQIGVVPQDPFLFSGSIGENIRYGDMEASHEDIVEAAKTVGAHDFIIRMEKGYESPVGERGGNLSAGQRQLVCLARAILTNPPILILDEATSSVDTNAELIMQEALRHLTQERTTFIIAHRLSTVTKADRIIALEQGRIVEMGSHQELLAKKGLYAEMFEAIITQDLER